MCGYKFYDDCYSAMNQEQVVPKTARLKEDTIVSEIKKTYGSDVVYY